MVDFPVPVGGIAYSKDFAPSLLFAILYLVLTHLVLHRMLDRNCRTLSLAGSAIFTVERTVLFSLRASQARNESKRFSLGIITYMQISFGLCYIIMAFNVVHVLRCLLVNPTYGSDMYFQSPAAATEGGTYSIPPPGTPDQPRLRVWMRRLTGYISMSSLAAIIPGLIANAHYSKVFSEQKTADQVISLRYASAGVTLAMCLAILPLAFWSSKKFTNNSKRGTSVVYIVEGLMAVVAIYRISVNHFKMTSLSGPSSLNDAGEKAAFYVFHVLPEWLAMATLLVLKIRKLCGTGSWGDYRWRDTPLKQSESLEVSQEEKMLKLKN